MLLPPQNKKGFTLMELLLVSAVMIFLAIVALSSLMKSQDQFRFKSVVNNTADVLRTVRNYALSNKPAPTSAAPQYVAKIDSSTGTIQIFGDNNKDGNFDSDSDPVDKLFKTYTIPANSGKYTLMKNKDDISSIQPNLTLIYQPTTANFSILEQYFSDRYAVIKITDSVDENRFTYIVLFKESGNPEVLNNLDDL